MWILNKRLKGYIFFLHHCSRIKFLLTPNVSVFSTLKYEYLGENEAKNENILTRWSVTHAGSYYEKNGGPKSRWTVPLM